MNSFTVCTGTCVCFCSACRRINCCQGHQGGWNWWWWHHTKWLSPPVVSATVPDWFWFQLSKSILSFLWILSFEIWRGWLLHQWSVDHRLAQEVWHRRDSLPLQETLWWTGVFRGAGSYHWKPGCHGNKSYFIVHPACVTIIFKMLQSCKVGWAPGVGSHFIIIS